MPFKKTVNSSTVSLKTKSEKNLKIFTRLFFILIMLWVGRNAIFIRPRENYSSIDMLALIQIGVVMMIFVLLFLSPMAGFWKQIKNSSIKFYLIYLLFGAVSALWSVNPAYSLYRAMEALALSISILYFCSSAMTQENSIRRSQLIMWSTLLASWVGLVLLFGFSFSLRHNGFGAIAALTCCFFAALFLADRKKRNHKILFQIGLGFIFILISMSLASWWSFWFGIFYCSLFIRHKGLLIILVLIGTTIFMTVEQDTRRSLLLRDKSTENLSSMTGRKILWADYMWASKKRPLLGYGYAMGAREVGARYTTNTHNVFFGALLGVGWVGVAILGLFIISLALELLRYRHHRNPAWIASAAGMAAGWLNTMSLSILGEQFILATTIFMALLGLHLFFLSQEKYQPLFRTKYIIRW